ncbi:hypothetical protein BT93_C0251 [Corymbia citriodora subsp. variegata]|nr:hypothetical protein BT93_C0251 [Corymbia citriodora subsp. variegata]
MAHSAFVSIFFAGRSSFWFESPRLSGVRAPSRRQISTSLDHLRRIDRLLSAAMAQKQHHKSNTKKQPHVKKQRKQADNTQFRAQLDALGLKIVQVTADGNCFFRALVDQLEGDRDEHGKYQSMVVQYILKNREMFEPFIEDDVPFDEYCKTMDNDGMWAGHMELQAASLVTWSNICVDWNISPRWYTCNFDQPGACMIHLSYHDEEHYNNVRLKEDTGDGPARPTTIKLGGKLDKFMNLTDSNLSSSSCQAKAGSNKSKSGSGKDTTDAGSIKLVMTLLQMYGDVDAAIEYLIAEQGIEDFSEETIWSLCNADASHGDGANENSDEQRQEPVEETYKENPPSNSAKRTHDDGSAQREDKKIPKACPCGLKKKYKSCCGSGTGKVSAISNEQALESSKSRKEKKRGKRGSDTSALSTGSDGGPPDMGALCI